jgi:hypothetical protein
VYVVILPENVRRLGMSISVAYFVSWIDYRTRQDNAATYLYGGERWWRVTYADMGDEMGVNEKIARRLVEHGVKYGAVRCEEHHTLGWNDRAKSYTVLPEFRLCPSAQTGSSIQKPKRADVPILFKEVNNIRGASALGDEKQQKTPKKKSSPRRAIPLPNDWAPTDNHRVKAEALGVDVEATAQQMRKWAFAGDRTSKSWNMTFNNFLANAKSTSRPKIGGRAELARLVEANDREGVFALVGDRWRAPRDVQFIDDPKERADKETALFHLWASEKAKGM